MVGGNEYCVLKITILLVGPERDSRLMTVIKKLSETKDGTV